jgi:hypothetical protein
VLELTVSIVYKHGHSRRHGGGWKRKAFSLSRITGANSVKLISCVLFLCRQDNLATAGINTSNSVLCGRWYVDIDGAMPQSAIEHSITSQHSSPPIVPVALCAYTNRQSTTTPQIMQQRYVPVILGTSHENIMTPPHTSQGLLLARRCKWIEYTTTARTHVNRKKSHSMWL